MIQRKNLKRAGADVEGEIEKFKAALRESEYVVIGAGAGLSTSAGFTYAGERFRRYFQNFIDRYHFKDMYTGGFYPFPSLEETWAYWSRYVFINRYLDPPKPVYQDLFALVQEKDYFVLTTNVDHCFQRAGFDKARLFYTQGDFGLWQCGVPCHQKTYENETAIREMVARQSGMRIPSELIPYCPVCGEPMTMNLRADDTFVQDEGWVRASKQYAEFLESRKGKSVLFLELGVGMNTPVIIKYPFWRMTAENPKARYACLNAGEAYCPEEIADRSILLDGDIGEMIKRLNSAMRD